jgi:hypothetical protein
MAAMQTSNGEIPAPARDDKVSVSGGGGGEDAKEKKSMIERAATPRIPGVKYAAKLDEAILGRLVPSWDEIPVDRREYVFTDKCLQTISHVIDSVSFDTIVCTLSLLFRFTRSFRLGPRDHKYVVGLVLSENISRFSRMLVFMAAKFHESVDIRGCDIGLEIRNKVEHLQTEIRVLSTAGWGLQAPGPLSFLHEIGTKVVVNHEGSWTEKGEVFSVLVCLTCIFYRMCRYSTPERVGAAAAIALDIAIRTGDQFSCDMLHQLFRYETYRTIPASRLRETRRVLSECVLELSRLDKTSSLKVSVVGIASLMCKRTYGQVRDTIASAAVHIESITSAYATTVPTTTRSKRTTRPERKDDDDHADQDFDSRRHLRSRITSL